MPGAQTRPEALRGRRLGGRGRAARYLRADHVELAVVLQLELHGLLPEGLAERHHHHCGGGGERQRPGCERSGGPKQGRAVPSLREPKPGSEGRARPGRALAPPPPGTSAAAAVDNQAALSTHARASTLTRALPSPKQKTGARPRGPLKGTYTRFSYHLPPGSRYQGKFSQG